MRALVMFVLACDTACVAPDQSQTLADVMERSDAIDSDTPKLRFLAAAQLSRTHDPEAVPRLEAILRGDRSDETVEYAANMLLDNLNRAGRYHEMAIWVDDLRADGAFMAGKDDLQQTLDHLHVALASR